MLVVVSQSRVNAPVTIIQTDGVFDSTVVEEFIESAQNAIDNCTVKTLLHLCGIPT